MESKCVPSYRQVFEYIENYMIQLDPKSIHSDYEASLVKALRIVYPSAKIHGCWFHYCQAIRKRMGKGRRRQLFKDLNNRSDAYNIYQKLLKLPLLPATKIPEGFEIVKQEAIEKNQIGTFGAIFNYYEKYWLKKVNHIFIDVPF